MSSNRAHQRPPDGRFPPEQVPERPSVAQRRTRGPSLSPGGQIGRYVLQDKLGQGSFGLIFTARDTVLERAVAIKILNPAHQYNADVLRRFLQEALASARVVHPGIVTVHDYGTVPNGSDGETAYIVLELLQGESLTSRLERTSRFQFPWAIEIARQVASALDCAHKAGVLHRDLKSENIYLVPDPAAVNGERAKVLDFGLAKVGPGQHTQMNTVFGTPRYMSPEQCRSATAIDERSDIYSLGCVLFELVTGRTPFSGDLRQQLEGHKHTVPPRASAYVPEIPAALDELIASMLAKDPAARPQTMASLQQTFYGFNAAALAQASHPSRSQIPMPVASAPIQVSPQAAATMLPTAASMFAPATAQLSVAALARKSAQFEAPRVGNLAPLPRQLDRTTPMPYAQFVPPNAFGADEMEETVPRAAAYGREAIEPMTQGAGYFNNTVLQPKQGVAFPQAANVINPSSADYHLAPHLPSLKKQPVRAGIAGAAIAFLIVAVLTAIAARGHMKAASASPVNSNPVTEKN